ncbi:hypothetical protein [Bacillus sp. Marseille-Q3570]|uniref:hypothetical protein n=1 Tax=Bacillus sp. Marseille-Q3570 TaxID=2963522 RepID=UPI0021B83C66|nr:hypothetical protein [Bacillus sp. Marseille-Q3570]
MVKPKVISIAAVSGGGKTTITKKLSEKLKFSKALFFDMYDFEGSPDDLIKWVEEGPDYDQWNLKPLISDLQSLLSAEEPSPYILLDYPFAYKNNSIKSFIDLSIYIDTPLDIAMVRRLLRDHTNSSTFDIQNDLDFYLNYGRTAYLEMENTIKPNSDLIIDGTLSLNEIVDTIENEVRIL